MRNYEFLISQDDKNCPEKGKRIAEADGEQLKPIQSITNKRGSANFFTAWIQSFGKYKLQFAGLTG